MRTDQCETPSGHCLEGYHVLEYPDWVNIVAITKDLKIVLVKQYRHGAKKIFTAVPSGTVDGKENPKKTARRELEEETGYVAEALIHVGSYFVNPATQTNRCHTFFAPFVKKSGKRKDDPTEEIEVSLAPFKSFVQGSLAGKHPMQSLHVAAMHYTLGYLIKSKNGKLKRIRNLFF